VREVLEVIYEQDFLDWSYGFRPGRSAHDAIRTLDRIVHRGEVSWILEADIVSFFDSLDRGELKKMLETRVADGSLLRLIGKCLQMGVLDGAELSAPGTGTAQGSVLSPLLGNVYLHYVLDLWFETEVRPRLRGRATWIRYADDLVIGFEHEEDARRALSVLGQRLGRFGLTLHPDKTRLLPFRRPPAGRRAGRVRPASTSSGSRSTGRALVGVAGGWRARLGGRAYDGRSSPSPIGAISIGTFRSRFSTQRSRDDCGATSTTSASAATFAVCCGSSKPRSGLGPNGCAVAASARA
jgi:hypothetical protein